LALKKLKKVTKKNLYKRGPTIDMIGGKFLQVLFLLNGILAKIESVIQFRNLDRV